MKRLSYLLLSLCALVANAQDATVNKDVTTVVCKSLSEATITHHTEITINNKQADQLACFGVGLEHKSIELTSFSGVITDASGKVLKKVKKSDLQMSEYSSNFKTNAYSMSYEYTPNQFPVHVTYDYTMEFSDFVATFSSIAPLPEYNVNVEEASYSLTVPQDMKVNYFAKNTTAQVQKSDEQVGGKAMTVYRVTMNNLPAMKDEPLSPSFRDAEPSIEFVPAIFNCYGQQGSFESWKELGLWNWKLYDGRQAIPESLAAEVDKAIAAAPDKKIEQCCALMRRITRYVSIQLGIGGWQPEKASVTAQTGFGDCKALTCLLMGVLEHVGIKSYPVIVNTNSRNLKRDYASLNQCNHVFLCVPQEKDTLWIECTNFELPVGYRHDGMAGHNAVVITPEGGEFVTIPDYSPKENAWNSEITIIPSADGQTQMDIHHTARNAQYENLYGLTHRTEQEQKKALTGRWNLGRVEEFKNFEMKAEENAPLLTTTISTESTGYATITGSRMFIPVNPMHKSHSLLPAMKDRTQKVSLGFGYEDKETIHIVIPEGYTVESLPKATEVETPFGRLTVSVEANDKQVDVVYDVVRNTYEGSADDYQAICDFVKHIHTAYGQKVILKK